MALTQARESLQYNLLGRRQRDVLLLVSTGRYRSGACLDANAGDCRAFADETAQQAPQGWLAPGALGEPLAVSIWPVNRSNRISTGFVRAISPAGSRSISTELAELQDAIARRSSDYEEQLRPGGWIYLGEVVALATQLVTDLSAPAEFSITEWTRP